ncbi:MAG: tetratricopeptide repeat protein [Nitrospirota bacterium]|nr:tetratricopeptide repeat protein [Nitrospirota bacterium]MDH5587226.1 tetratricopeptide repeat protein [Nitrospirota bacterium]MDH5775965.1 tetratricopeptide repeat protein [Nitrospirota bacterium]
MRATWAIPLLAATTLYGLVGSSTAVGSHLDSSLSRSGPPSLPQPSQDQESGPTFRTTPVSVPQLTAQKETIHSTEPTAHPSFPKQRIPQAKPHTNLGWTFLLNGQTQAAMAAYRQALRHNPQSAPAYLGLGISLKTLGEVELAKKAFGKAIDLDPRLPSALVHLGYLHAEGHFGMPDPSTARQLFKKAALLGDPFAAIALLDLRSGSTL